MAKPDLSILIPARREMFLRRTIDDILVHKRANTNIIVGLDGEWADPPIENHPDVHIIYHSKSIGQRAITNECAKLSNAKYLMKVDAHCSFDEGFDDKMLAVMQDDWTLVPVMRNLHAFDWVCPGLHRRYQSPSAPCKEVLGKDVHGNDIMCGKPTTMDICWIAKTNPQSTSYCFDAEPHFQYFKEYKTTRQYRQDRKKGLTETMSLQGSCFMVTRNRYFDLNLCDEDFGSWGSQGIEVAVKSWLSGGRVLCNHNTWYAHMFRTQGGDFGFPYPQSGRAVEAAKKRAKEIFFHNKWPKQKYPLSWLIDKFWPIPGWTDDDRMAVKEAGRTFGQREIDKSIESTPHYHKTGPKKGLCFYTDNKVAPYILDAVKTRLIATNNGHRLVSVSLQPLDFGENIVMNLQRSHLTMAKQQLAGLEALDVDIVFMIEHDILYPACHFDFIPPRKDVFYYNLNWWKVRESDGQALHFKAKQVSGLCAYRDILLEYYRNRVRMIESGEIGGRRHFEPGSHYRDAYGKLTSHGFDTWWSEIPYVDIRHDTVVTRNIFDPSGYRGRVVDWTMSDSVPSWGISKGRFKEFLKDAIQKAPSG